MDVKIQKHPSTSMEYRVDAPRCPWISKIIERGDRGKCAILPFFFFFFTYCFLRPSGGLKGGKVYGVSKINLPSRK